MLLIEQLIPTGFSIRRLTEEYSYNNYTTFFKQYKQYAKKSPNSNKNKPNATKLSHKSRTFLNIGSNFGNIVKPFVSQNLLFRKVAMIVENRHILCVSFVKFYRRFVFKKKIIP